MEAAPARRRRRRSTRRPTRERPLGLAYIRVSTVEQADEGLSLDAQRATLTEQAERRGWDVEVVADEGRSAKDLDRPGLQAALARLDRGEADVLVAIRLDRFSRDLHDFSGLMKRADREGWRLLCLDPEVDTSTPYGKAFQHIMAVMAELERQLIGQRTREALAQLKAQGVALGQQTAHPDQVLLRILSEREEGKSYARIADDLNRNGITTVRGGRWYPPTVQRAAESQRAQALIGVGAS
jgi:DNA invertase Pin-like site-specific DNA recombinase